MQVMGTMADKDHMRRHLMAAREARSACDAVALEQVLKHISGLPCMTSATVLAAYMATPGEVDVSALFGPWCVRGGTVWLPRYEADTACYRMVAVVDFKRDLVLGHHGITEPARECRAVDDARRRGADVLWLVPGVGFDAQGHRIGRGKGYYDRMLAGTAGVRVGVAWDWQFMADVPVTATDVSMHWLVTETHTIACGGQNSPRTPLT